MPLFEYICTDCGQEFEKIVPSHKTEVRCVGCQSLRVEKQLSVFAVAGSGDRSMAENETQCGTCGADQPGMCQM